MIQPSEIRSHVKVHQLKQIWFETTYNRLERYRVSSFSYSFQSLSSATFKGVGLPSVGDPLDKAEYHHVHLSAEFL